MSRDGSPTGEPERFRFTEDRALFFWPEHRLERFVSGRSPGEGLRLELSPRRSGRFRITVPAPLLLCNWRDYVGHPAFWELGIQALPEERGLLLRRLRRGELPEQWACLRCDREVLVRTDPPALSLELRLEEGEKTGIAFALGLGDSPDAARRAAEQILRDPDPARLPGAVAQRLGMSAADFGETMARKAADWSRIWSFSPGRPGNTASPCGAGSGNCWSGRGWRRCWTVPAASGSCRNRPKGS